jgi:D-alanine-D-alanine ligase-like ATP-grasp enzyme
MEKKRVGILRGGNKEHYEKSLRKGGELLLFIQENLADKWKPVDVLVDTEGVWHVGGLPIKPVELVNKVDIVWNTTHPNFSVILKNLAIPNVGVDSFPFLLSGNRSILQEHMKEIGVKMPRHFVIPAYQEDFDGSYDKFILKKAKEVHEKFSPPWIIKSLTNDFDVPTHVAKIYSELINAIEDILKHGKSILVEELITGKNISMHSVSGFRGQEVYNLPAVGSFFPGEKEKLNEVSKKIHQHLNIRNYLNSSFVSHPKRGIFLKQIEFFPDLQKDSHFEQASIYVGSNPKQIIDHILEQALF